MPSGFSLPAVGVERLAVGLYPILLRIDNHHLMSASAWFQFQDPCTANLVLRPTVRRRHAKPRCGLCILALGAAFFPRVVMGIDKFVAHNFRGALGLLPVLRTDLVGVEVSSCSCRKRWNFIVRAQKSVCLSDRTFYC